MDNPSYTVLPHSNTIFYCTVPSKSNFVLLSFSTTPCTALHTVHNYQPTNKATIIANLDIVQRSTITGLSKHSYNIQMPHINNINHNHNDLLLPHTQYTEIPGPSDDETDSTIAFGADLLNSPAETMAITPPQEKHGIT